LPLLRSFLEKLNASPPASRAGQQVTAVASLDGVKLSFAGRGWLLLRLSGTEPMIRIYAEHEDPSLIEPLLDETERDLRAFKG